MGLGRKKGPGGGGGVGAVLTVTAPAGVTVSVSKDGKTKTKTANADGLAVFKGLATGTWTLTITDGSQTSTKPVSVTADYSTVIAFFSATINITYPSGSTCTCSDGSTTFTAPDTSGTWACIVPNTGTWTVSCTNGTESKSKTVSITADGQTVSVKLLYWDGSVYNQGDQYEHITGGWFAESCSTNGGTTFESDSIKLRYGPEGNAWTGVGTKNSIDMSEFSTLKFDMKISGAFQNSGGKPIIGVTTEMVKANKITSNDGGFNTFKANARPAVDNVRRTVSVDVSALSSGYVSVYGIMNAYIYRIWFE